jgi:ParB family chromosome partitioning protein
LEDDEEKWKAFRYIVDHQLTVAKTEEYIETLLNQSQAVPRKKPIVLIKDVRLFLNTITRGLTLMRSAGVDAQCDREDTEDEVLLTIRIPKAPAK